jgi:hypothetical protein
MILRLDSSGSGQGPTMGVAILRHCNESFCYNELLTETNKAEERLDFHGMSKKSRLSTLILRFCSCLL